MNTKQLIEELEEYWDNIRAVHSQNPVPEIGMIPSIISTLKASQELRDGVGNTPLVYKDEMVSHRNAESDGWNQCMDWYKEQRDQLIKKFDESL